MIFLKNRSGSVVISLIFILLFTAHLYGQSTNTAAADGWKKLNNNLAADLSSSERGINSSIIDALKIVPRHRFLAPAYEKIAYDNIALPGYDKAILPSPSDSIRAIRMLSPASTDTVLVAGNNAGYAAAVLSRLSKKVYLIEETSAAADYSSLFKELGFENITLADTADINAFKDIIAFDRIYIHGAVSGVSENITERLSIQGNITVILAAPGAFQQIITIRRSLLGDNISCGGSCYFPEIKTLKISN